MNDKHVDRLCLMLYAPIITLVTGTILIIVGVVQVFAQDFVFSSDISQIPQSQGISVAGGDASIGVTSRYPGITMIIVGAILQTAASLVAIPFGSVFNSKKDN